MIDSHQKVLWILTICTILIFKTNSLANSNEKVSSGYFYKTSYEGMAGYCAVITPELSDVSKIMSKILNIKKFNQSNTNDGNLTTNPPPPKNNPKKNKTFAEMSMSNRITISKKANPITLEKQNGLDALYTYIHSPQN